MTTPKTVEVPGGIWGPMCFILAKHGPWAFVACLFIGIVVIFQLKPAAEAQKGITKDRQILMDSVTRSLEMNSESMSKMSGAVNGLENTLGEMNHSNTKTQMSMDRFTASVRLEHDEHQALLKTIQKEIQDNP